MDGKTTSLKTLIGLPIVFVIAIGIAYGASAISRSLRQDPGRHVTTNKNVTVNTANVNSASVAKYNQAIDELTSIAYQRLVLSSAITNTSTTASQASAANIAQTVLATVCWLQFTPSDLKYFPEGTVRQEFSTLVTTYANPADPIRACDQVSEQSQLQASRLLTVDDDGDELNVVAEYWYGTDQFSKDTDGDGFTDSAELANGFNPLGPGPQPK